MKKRNLLIYILSLVVVMSILGGSYAYLRVEKESGNQTIDLVDSFGIEITKELAGLNLTDQVPLSDDEGVKGEARSFQITNKGSILSEYKVSLIDNAVVSTLENKDVRYRLTKTKSSTVTPEVLEIKNLSDDGLIDSGTIAVGETIDYEIVCWIDYDVTEGGGTFSKKVMVEGSQPLNLDKSGANPPEMLDNMIPVYYDGGWKVADATNRDEDHKWYDYDAKMWANAVTIKSNSSVDYTIMGTSINDEDITSMWVWIPRYKYTIFNNQGTNLDEKSINIKFEYGINSTGTVTCTDENCGTVTDNLSTYTHPAFKFGDKELVGFWFSKFEMSSPGATEVGTNPIYVKPNQESLRNITPLNMFKSVRNMEASGNIHGFSQDEKATTVSDDGTIANDNNNFDIHLETNMEWGAVAYLAMSRYGINGEITPNKNYTSGDTVSLKTGYANTDTSYSDATDGVKASTTGTIYGVYDMVGGANELVMGTTTPSTFTPNAKYYTKYTTLGKLGDGTKEVTKSDTNRWYDGIKAEFDTTNIWLTRGGTANSETGFSIFTNGVTDENANQLITSRPTLTIEREFPWLSSN